MNIRAAKTGDIPGLVPLCKAFCCEMGFPFDEESVKITMLKHMQDENCLVLVAEENERLVGLGGVMTAPSYTDYTALRAIETVWHSDPRLSPLKRARIMVMLFDEMEAWVKEKGLPFHISSGNPRTEDFLLKRGYDIKEVHYCKERL